LSQEKVTKVMSLTQIKKCDESILSLFSEESDAFKHENIFVTRDVLGHFLPKNCHFLAPLVQKKFKREEM